MSFNIRFQFLNLFSCFGPGDVLYFAGGLFREENEWVIIIIAAHIYVVSQQVRLLFVSGRDLLFQKPFETSRCRASRLALLMLR